MPDPCPHVDNPPAKRVKKVYLPELPIPEQTYMMEWHSRAATTRRIIPQDGEDDAARAEFVDEVCRKLLTSSQ